MLVSAARGDSRGVVGIIRDAVVIKTCLHRFCDKCLKECLRSGIKECPSCRAPIGPKRSSIGRDVSFDQLIAAVYPDLERYEAAEDERIATAITPKRLQQDDNVPSPSGKRAKGTARVGILWEEQPFDDCYVDSSFLEQLRTNGTRTRTSSTVMQYSCGDTDMWQGVKEGMLFSATLSILSPVLRTLTESYAVDTIWALSVALTGIHLITHDYTYINGTTYKYAGTISLNAAIFTSVLLASLLHSNEQVFSFVLFAIEVFAVSPIAQHTIKKTSEHLHVALALVLFCVALALMWPISPSISVVVFVAVVFITFVCPLWLMHAQEYKKYVRSSPARRSPPYPCTRDLHDVSVLDGSEIQGPWDIAKVEPQQ
ncbi:hypothetical protein DYB32_000784 [Aphanomyces invadans]|uniref:Zinc finger C3HC4 RING-type domain-containing protein n=1 Tax=Aphanomyces invadans TaxID=157072 RepID=A0A418B8V4_9STRA|nr:hypothetical protein DYB32_000784 [Aphanomyces invadans]